MENDTYNLRGYIFIMIGQLISLLGSQIVQFSIIWWLALQTESAIIMGVATFMGMAPLFITTLIAGVYVDRWKRKKVWNRLNQILREELRIQEGRERKPSAASVDSQSVKTTQKRGRCMALTGVKR